MNTQSMNRRRFLTLSTATAGGVLAASPLAMAATQLQAVHYVSQVIQQHFPETVGHEAVVERFARDLLGQRLESLEPSDFVRKELRKLDTSNLERFIVVQFATSPVYLEIIGQP